MLEQLGAVIGGLFVFAKVISVIKAVLFTEDVVKKLAYNDREDYIKGHVFENHQESLKLCRTNQCASF